MQNEVLDLKDHNEEFKKKKNKKSLILTIIIIVIFLALLLSAIFIFTKPVTVSFNPGYNGAFGKVKSVAVDDDGYVSVPDINVEREHYEFIGWFTTRDGNGEPIDFSKTTFKKSTNVYAVYEMVKYQISYIYGLDENDHDYTFSSYDPSQIFEGTADNPNPSFYTFKHDTPTREEIERYKDVISLNFNLNLYVQENGLRLVNPKKDGWTFKGWRILDTNGNEITGINVSMIRSEPKGDIILQAIWE